MDRSPIISLPAVTGGGNPVLYLLGGVSTDFSKMEEKETNRVWELRWDHDSLTYYWTEDYSPALGGYQTDYNLIIILSYNVLFTDLLFMGGTLAVAIPDTFITSFDL